MIKKRLISSIICKDNLVVQSFNYKYFLPLGSIESSIKNFNRWQADEILILSIDRFKKKLGPNLELLDKIKNLNIETPIIYGGGISTVSEAKKVLELGADRIVLESIINENFKIFSKICEHVGSQSVILSLPLNINAKNDLSFYDYKSNQQKEISENFKKAITKNLISEILVTDYKNQGMMKGFNINILKKIKFKKNLILSGGINKKIDFENIFKDKRVAACAVGNNLNYKEQRVQKIKSELCKKYFRKPNFMER